MMMQNPNFPVACISFDQLLYRHKVLSTQLLTPLFPGRSVVTFLSRTKVRGARVILTGAARTFQRLSPLYQPDTRNGAYMAMNPNTHVTPLTQPNTPCPAQAARSYLNRCPLLPYSRMCIHICDRISALPLPVSLLCVCDTQAPTI